MAQAAHLFCGIFLHFPYWQILRSACDCGVIASSPKAGFSVIAATGACANPFRQPPGCVLSPDNCLEFCVLFLADHFEQQRTLLTAPPEYARVQVEAGKMGDPALPAQQRLQ
ncbi:hypothetical protein MJ581_13550 [Escherichia coli]|nr:hypothetical protein MJ581_13550 [Escherichia coli]